MIKAWVLKRGDEYVAELDGLLGRVEYAEDIREAMFVEPVDVSELDADFRALLVEMGGEVGPVEVHEVEITVGGRIA